MDNSGDVAIAQYINNGNTNVNQPGHHDHGSG